ncbi:disease resistance protein L6 isoform X2 [Physcomitrium patens]|uniref:Protein kinase domain-containing protein n=3 Tax=Physcomitrium patens TaxID=3218 RepID=A0A7I4FB46_PHYPA|nr:TMV resistance protein N-like isoform X1 [Physcomitrium patens]|eukprot:XP_024390847.1 TMV resistance protein N-like isoform X1 [Physcomitrella patens]
MCYMHDMKVAHRDLKSNNVIINLIDISNVESMTCVYVKLLDFDISKVEVKNTPQTPTGRIIGTIGYMAPKVINNNRDENSWLKVDALKADVFNFGMLCSEIILGSKPFGGEGHLYSYQSKIESGKRPDLSNACSKELKLLVENCWTLDPLQRPTFLEIYSRLKLLKKKMHQRPLEGRGLKYEENTSWMGIGIWQFFATLIQGLWFLCQIRKINLTTSLLLDQENFGPLNQIIYKVNGKTNKNLKLIGVEEKVFELEKKLQNVSSLGIIGMGGIGKSTLAKALSNYIFHKFQVICFIDDLKDGKCRLLLKNILEDLHEQSQVYSLQEGRNMLKNLQKRKKILIVLDDVRSNNQLNELLGFGKFKDNDGNKLIATSRIWSSLEQHIPMHGRVDMEKLDTTKSMELFSMYAFSTNGANSLYFKDVVEKIVKACGGLPLSLEVMGTYLHGNQQLRIWERTLHRLLQARHDGSVDEKIWKTLRISFDDLNSDERNMFLDIACFFCHDSYPGEIGEGKLLRILSDDIEIPKNTLKNLQDKSLLVIDDNGQLHMHDQLRDMGRMLTETEYKGSRDRELCLATFNDCNQKVSIILLVY